MKRAIFISGIVVAALGVTAISVSAKGWGPGGIRGMGPMMNFEEMDLDKDGQVTKEEMAAFSKARFDAADANGDGFVDAAEMEAHIVEMARQKAEMASAKMIERKDADKDGKLSYEEMQPSDKRKDKMFSRFDADGDGVISQAEYDEAKAEMQERRQKWQKKKSGDK